jgi:PPK2 family polyphosphate:nucleotide phosphotransferase
MDASGKDSTIRHVMNGVNPQGVRVSTFKEPSAEELDHDYLWRHERRLPARGEIGIFNRSHYEEVLVVRVHPENLAREQLPPECTGPDIWNRRYREINDWERYLAGNGIRLVKLFLNVSREKQRIRFLRRIERPEKNWKFSASDVRERRYWDDYQRAYSTMLTHTSTEWAPWYVLPADHKWVTRLCAAAVIGQTLIDIDPRYPVPDEAARQELLQARAELEAEARALPSDTRGPGRMSDVHVLNDGAPVTDPLAPYAQVDRTRAAGGCWVMANMVGGLDGSAAIGGRVAALSTEPDAALFRLMRALADVVLVGAETVRREGYRRLRLPEERAAARQAAGRPRTPRLAVVTRSLDLDWSTEAFAGAPPESRALVITCKAADPGRLERAREVADVVIAGQDRVEPEQAVLRLSDLGHRVVLCEGGPTLLGELVAADRLDELCLTIAPLMGGDPLPVSVSPPGAPLRHFALRHVMRDGDTLFLRYERDGHD